MTLFSIGITEDGRVFIQDEKGRDDARLYVNGDFASKDAELSYAQIIATTLGARQSTNVDDLTALDFSDDIKIDMLLQICARLERHLWFTRLDLDWERTLRNRIIKGEDCRAPRWYPIADAPRTPVETNPAYDFAPYLHGPMLQLLIDLGDNVNGDGGKEPRYLVAAGWWSPENDCWRHTDDDGPNDLQPIAWCPFETQPVEKLEF